jgi:hypothetical protein
LKIVYERLQMIICDVCENKNLVKKIKLFIYYECRQEPSEYYLDLCENCMEYCHPSSLIIGIKEQRKHEPTDEDPSHIPRSLR